MKAASGKADGVRQQSGFENEQRRDEDVVEIVDDEVEHVTVDPRRKLLHPGGAGQRAVDAVHDQRGEQPQHRLASSDARRSRARRARPARRRSPRRRERPRPQRREDASVLQPCRTANEKAFTVVPQRAVSAAKPLPRCRVRQGHEQRRSKQPLPEPGRNCWRVERADRASLIVDAADYFRLARQAMLRAEKQILLIGWDFDTRICLDFEADDGAPVELGAFLSWLPKNRPGLQIHILKWDIGAIKLLGRGTTVLRLARWAANSQIHFKLDGAHAVGASHHHKIVVIDDRLAFCGGIDMTADRWDTRGHLRRRRASAAADDQAPLSTRGTTRPWRSTARSPRRWASLRGRAGRPRAASRSSRPRSQAIPGPTSSSRISATSTSPSPGPAGSMTARNACGRSRRSTST